MTKKWAILASWRRLERIGRHYGGSGHFRDNSADLKRFVTREAEPSSYTQFNHHKKLQRKGSSNSGACPL